MTTEPLIVTPDTYGNPTLKANLDALFRRYPYERSRLEPLISVPIENRPAAKIDLPACPTEPPLRVLLLAGIGTPQFLATILNDPVVQKNMFQMFIIENNLDFLRYAFQHSNLVQILNFEKTEWLLLHNEESIKPAFFRVLKREHVASMMKNVHMLETPIPQPEEVTAFYKQIPAMYDETTFHVFHNFGRIDDSLEGVRATLLNKEAILSYPGIHDLKNSYRGLPALICGAGPSLDKELTTIKANNDKFVVIAADAALKPLLNAGIRVDYVTSIERLNDYQKPFFEGLEGCSAELVAFPVIQPDLFKIYPGPKRVVYRNYSFFAYFEKNWPKGILKCGGSTSHLAIRLADWFGCSRAILVGIDSAYEQKEGTELYRSHCEGTGHPEWSEFVGLNEFCVKRQHLPPLQAISNEGKTVMTNLTYYQWIKEYGEELAEIGQRMTILNASAQGLHINGVDYRKLSEFASHLNEQPIQKKPATSSVTYNRHFKHAEIVENFHGWDELLTSLTEECDALLKMGEPIELKRFDALIFLYNFKTTVDPLFVSFVVQCCAKEFFELENQWWALEQDWDQDLKEKVMVTKERALLFSHVVKKLISIFEEAK